MLRHKPQYTYNGLTVILSNKSRLDETRLLNGNGGGFFEECIQPDFTRYHCDIRLKEDLSPFLPGTKCILLCGETACRLWTRNTELTIGAARGSVFYYDGRFTGQDCTIPMIPSFFPQDCVDIKNYEKEYNSQDDANISDDDGEDEDGNPKRRHGKTARRNYAFFFRKDIQKCKHILGKGIPKRLFEPIYQYHPQSDFIIDKLQTTKDTQLFLDLETYYPLPRIQCVGISFGTEPNIYVIPFYSHDCSWAYSCLPHVLRALAVGIANNITVAHNGANFDFPVLAWQYRIPIGKRVEDTMIMTHRCFPDVEKSLGHLTSLWTWEPFHKDEGEGGYNTPSQVYDKMVYCGKDIFTMKLAYFAMLEYAKTRPGLLESMRQGNASIRPYLTTMLQGFRFKEEILRETMAENDKLMTQYWRFIKYLVGEHNLPVIQGKSKMPMPSSNPQCTRYFHDLLGYPVVGRGKETKTGERNPSLGKKNLLKLRLKHENPVIDLCMAYREVQKESGSLKFTPFNFNNKSIYQKPLYEEPQKQEINQASLFH